MLALQSVNPREPQFSLREFFHQHVKPQLTDVSPRGRWKYTFAITLFERYLCRPAMVADLAELQPAVQWLTKRVGNSSVSHARARLCRIARQAAAEGHLPHVPYVMGEDILCTDRPVWSLAEVNRILASARAMPGEIDGHLACHWWPAFLLTILETAARPSKLLALSFASYNAAGNHLAIDARRIAVHGLTAEWLGKLGAESRERLFPWPWDRGRPPFHMLLRTFKTLLWRADLPFGSGSMFERYRATAARQRGLVERVNMTLPVALREGQPQFVRARDRKRGALPGKSRRKIKPRGKEPTRSLWVFVAETYQPLRCVGGSPRTFAGQRESIRALERYAGRKVTLDDLTDDFLQHFIAWGAKQGLAPRTVNKHVERACAFWRYAYRKRLLQELPRDIDKLRELKRQPKAWSIAEVERILAACQTARGSVCGIPANQWWLGLVLVLYYTGLRIQATLAITVENVDFETGQLFVPADDQKQKADQSFRLLPEVLDVLQGTQPGDRQLLFPFRYGRHTLRDQYRAILQSAGLPCGPRELFHKLRRTSATHLAATAGDAAAMHHLGHSGMSVTRRYLDPTQIKRADAATLLPRPQFKLIG